MGLTSRATVFSRAVITCDLTPGAHLCEGEPVGMYQSVHIPACVSGEAKFKGKCVTVSEPEPDHVPGTECACMIVSTRVYM